MSRVERVSPVPKYLGVSADADAFDLLGIGPDQCTSAQVEASLQRQLDRIDSHVEADTPEADEVRLALHAAAAQALDGASRRRLIEARQERGRGSGSPTTSAGSAASAPEPVATVGARYTPEPDSNAPVRQIVLFAGIGGGIVVVALVLSAIFLVPSGTKGPATQPTPTGGSTSKDSGAQRAMVQGQPAVGDVASAQAAPAGPVSPAPVRAGRSEFVDGAVAVRRLRAATAKARENAAAGLVEFRGAVAPLADWWVKYAIGERRAADDAVLEFVYVVSTTPDVAKEMVGDLARMAALEPVEAGPLPAERVWPAAWATGVLCRLGEERGLPRSVAVLVAQAINDTLGAGRAESAASFDAGAAAALRRMPIRMVAPTNPAANAGSAEPALRCGDGVKLWAEAVGAVCGDEMEQERMLVDALEEILIDGPSPDQDRASFEAIEALVTRIRWRAGGSARGRLLDWFNDTRVSAADMRAVTTALAGKSGAEGVEASMQLSVTASPDDRAQLRARYASAWGLAKTEARAQALEEWQGKARSLMAVIVPDDKSDDLDRVARLAVAVRTSHAARRLWLGDAAGCLRIVGELERLPSTIRDIGRPPSGGAPSAPNPAPSPGPRLPRGIGPMAAAPPEPFSQGGVSWAEAYLRAERNIPIRLHRLAEADSLEMPLSRVDAAVLVEAAFFASPASVRLAAQRVVVMFADDPSIVQQCLDELPLAPRVQSISDTLARVSRTTLPKVGDPEWEIATRRALVERVLGQLAGQGPQAGIDQASALIAESYLAMAGADSGGFDESAADRCVRAAGELFKLWRMEADRLPPPEHAPLTLDQIERRRRSRERIASGPIQSFAGEQVSVAEMFAYIVSAERPVQAARAGAILEEMATQRRAADHVFDQMRVTEVAIARLWALRLGEGAQ